MVLLYWIVVIVVAVVVIAVLWDVMTNIPR
jgi:hypothetical protein